jgi:hypothetical protein
MSKSSNLEKNLANLSNENNSLQSRLIKITEIARETETELDQCKTTLREKEFEIEEVTTFYHKTLEDLAITCSELDFIKDSSTENMQRLKDQIAELSLELSVARRRSRGISNQYSAKISNANVPCVVNGKTAIGMVESLISDLNKKLKKMTVS